MITLIEFVKNTTNRNFKILCKCGKITFYYGLHQTHCQHCKEQLPIRYQFFTRYIGARLRYFKDTLGAHGW